MKFLKKKNESFQKKHEIKKFQNFFLWNFHTLQLFLGGFGR